MKAPLLFGLASLLAWAPLPAQEPSAVEGRTSVIIVTGAGGNADYTATFQKWAANWEKAATKGDALIHSIGGKEGATDSLEQLRQTLAQERKDGPAELWLILLGHGNAESKDAKFNLSGDDLAASELATLLKPFSRPLVLVNTFSASGGFLAPLAGPGRVIVSATKSGAEHNYTRLGGYLSEAIADPAADLDKDGQTSLLEAWLAAAKEVASFYENEGRLATEHSLLEDNGDGKGTPPDWFRGVRAVKASKDGTPSDGRRAQQLHLIRNAGEKALSPAQRTERDALEMELAQLRANKAQQSEADYFRALEVILLKLAAIYDAPAP